MMLWYGAKDTNGDGFSGQQEMHINLNGSGKVQFFIKGSGHVNKTTSKSYTDGEWHQAIATWDKAGKAYLYVDGGAGAGGETVSQTHTGDDFLLTGRHRSGKPATGGGGGRYFQGWIDEIAVFKRQLTAQDAKDMWAMSQR